jgi:hypothetical protein
MAAARKVDPGRNGKAPPQAPPDASPGWTWRPLDSPSFASADYRPTWLVKRLLVARQPAIIGGPVKSLKTSIAIDLAVSLASGKPFLGHFDVYRPVRVAVLSGESGNHTVQEIARRVCSARGVDLADLPVVWQFDLPQLANPVHRAELHNGIKAGGIEVVILDPLYLCLLSGVQNVEASNVFQMGPHLLAVADTCLRAGATPALTHHTNRPAMRKMDEALDLTDLSYAGCSEFARQWMLINRREAFAPGEPHRLRLAVGGSCGQSGLFAIDVDEGELEEDFGGRVWDVTVRPHGEAADELMDRREERRDAEKARRQKKKESKQDTAFLRALDSLDPDARGTSLRGVREKAKMNDANSKETFDRLRQEGIVEEIPDFRSDVGSGATRKATGLRRVRHSQEF